MSNVVTEEMLIGVKEGNEEAIDCVWKIVYPRVLAFARARFGNKDPILSGEDVASSALASFFRAAKNGRLPDLATDAEMWRIVARITVNKTISQNRKENAKKHGGGTLNRDFNAKELAQLMNEFVGCRENTQNPHFIVSMEDTVRNIITLLGDPRLVETFQMRLDGFTVLETSKKLNVGITTIERRLKLIRLKLSVGNHL